MEEEAQGFSSFFRSLFRKKVAAIEGAALDMIAPGFPDRDWSAFVDVPRIKWPAGAPQGVDRQDVESGKSVDAVRVVESHAVGDTTATIMPRNREAAKSQLLHNGNHVLRHCPFGVWRMVWSRRRTAAVAVAAKVGTHD